MTQHTTKKDKLELNYDVSRDITVWFLTEHRKEVLEYIEAIAKDVEHKNAYPAQLEDYYMYKEVLDSIDTLLKFHGVYNDSK